MAINFGDGSIQSFSGKIIQVVRNLRSTGTTTSSSSAQDLLTIDFTPKSNSSVIHCQLTGVAYMQSEPGGIRVRFYDNTDSNRFGASLGGDDPLVLRMDLQGGHSGDVFSYAGITWRAQEASWGATNVKQIKAQYYSAGGTVGFLSNHAPVTCTIMEVQEG
tara:strand:+ start:202 stop:684 length:483 start_codon:yes stop_codon:yes gene_type:complete